MPINRPVETIGDIANPDAYRKKLEAYVSQLETRIEDLEHEIGKGVRMSAYSFGYADGHGEATEEEMLKRFPLETKCKRYREALSKCMEMSGELPPATVRLIREVMEL